MPASTLLALIAWITVLLTSVYLRNRTPLLLFGVLFFIVGHSMESSFLALEMVYEHRNYLPSMGVFIAFVGCCHICFYREGMSRLYRYVPAITIPILFTLLLIRAESWSQALTLSGENVRVHPLSVRSNYAHGYSFLSLADDESLDSVQQVVALRASRQYFLRMHEIDQDDLAALVSLYRIDSSYFGQADQAAVWLELGYKAVNSKTLQPSDVSALNVLIECLVASGCEADSAIIWRILEVLDKKYPSNQHYIALRYRYLKFQGRDAQMRSDLAAKSIALQPYNPGFYRERIYQCSQIGDVDCMYENISQWFFYDSQRRDTLSIKRLFLVSDK